MPLPNASYTLQGQSKPGDPMYSKPKHGMLLRLSTEAVNALQSDLHAKPNVDFVVSEDGSSRIVIGDSSFSLQSQTEEIPHDLYLRSASAAKPFVPLKFYANVIGKLTISERELDDELASRIHKKTAAAAEQRSISKTKFIDANNLPQPTTKATAKKKSDLFRKPLRPSDQLKTSALNASASSAPSPRPSHTPKPSQDGITPMEKRLIHYLALAERTSEDAVKAVGGPHCDANTRQDILDAMHSLAEQGPANKGTQQIWRLKNESWLNVRPYEWPRLSEADRTNLARGARRALKSLGIPETDPRWEHAKYRPPANTARTNSPIPAPLPLSTSDSTHGSVSAPKRGISSKEAREKKTRKPDAKTEIMIKDETKLRPNHTPSPSASTAGSNGVKSTAQTLKAPTPPSTTGTPSMRLTPTMRRLPGSGYKLPPKTSDLSRSENKSKDGSVVASASSSSAASKDIDVAMKDVARRPIETKQKDEQRASASRSNMKKEEGELSTSSSGTGGIGVRTDDRPAPVKRVKHLRDEAMDSDRESDKGKDKSKERVMENRSRDSDRARERAKDRDRERSLERDHLRDREPTRRNGDVSSLKRKKVKEEEEEYDEGSVGSIRAAGKRRKTEKGMEALSANGSSRDRGRARDTDRELDRERDRERERGRDKGRERDDERERDNKDKERERLRDREIERDRDRDRNRDRERKNQRDGRSSKSTNELALDRKSSADSNTHSVKGKTTKLELSPLTSSPKKVKKEKPPVQRPTSTASNSSNKSSTKGTKFRRKSPIYTSSEDEDDPRHSSPALPTPSASSGSASSRHSNQSTNSASTNGNVKEHRDEPNHRNALRSKYTASYVKYLNTFQTLVSQKQEIERLLSRQSSGSRSDSDGDVELLDLDGLTKILSQNKQQWEELQSIQNEHQREMFS